MIDTSHLTVVTEKQFWDYLRDKSGLVVKRGDIFHSDVWYDKDDIVVAYMETSSWGAPDVYLLETGGFTQSNASTINVINSLFNKKQK